MKLLSVLSLLFVVHGGANALDFNPAANLACRTVTVVVPKIQALTVDLSDAIEENKKRGGPLGGGDCVGLSATLVKMVFHTASDLMKEQLSASGVPIHLIDDSMKVFTEYGSKFTDLGNFTGHAIADVAKSSAGFFKRIANFAGATE